MNKWGLIFGLATLLELAWSDNERDFEGEFEFECLILEKRGVQGEDWRMDNYGWGSVLIVANVKQLN